MSKGSSHIWKLREELRLVKYDVVFDFDSNALSIAIARAAKAEKVIGFDPYHIERPIPGGHLVYHDTFIIDGEMSNSIRMRHLVGRFLEHKVQQGRPSTIPSVARPSRTGSGAYIAIGGRVPKPLTDILEKAGLPIISPPTPQTPEDLVGLVQYASLVVGSGEITAMAALLGTKTMYVGNKADVPEGAVYMTTPKELTDTIQSLRADEEKAATDDAALDAPKPPADSGLKIKSPEQQ